MILVATSRNLRISFLGKEALFRFPLGWLMRATGGIPVDRSAPRGLVGQLVDRFNSSDTLALAIPVEGTRSRTEHWKSGFYRIAEQADIPLVLAFIDRTTKTSGFGPTMRVSGDIGADMDLIRQAYEGKVGIRPANAGPIRLREELDSSETPAIEP